MDDMESLIFSLWYIAGVPLDRKSFFIFRQPLGKTLAECKKNGKAEEKILVSSKLRKTLGNHSSINIIFKYVIVIF